MIIRKGFKKDGKGDWWYEYGKTKKRRMRGIIKICKHCSEEFVAVKQEKIRRNGEIKDVWLYCSRHCLQKDKPHEHFKAFKGEKHSHWKGGKCLLKKGYVEIYSPEHPYARCKKYVKEHRLVMEKHIGRYLYPYEQVHHKNAIKYDNRIENLQVIQNKIHLGEVSCPYCNKKFTIR